jgi:hypothetical protein
VGFARSTAVRHCKLIQTVFAAAAAAAAAVILQVPIRWFLPLLATEMIINVLGSLKYGLPLTWLAVRYSVCAVLPVAMFGLQQVQGRLRFCVRHGVRVQGRLLPALSWV